MSDERKSGDQPIAQIPILRSPRYQEIYANALKIKLTSLDCTIILGTTPDMPGTPGIVQEEVTVYMTHSFLKVLSRYFTALVQTIEGEMGTIKTPIIANPKEEDIASLREVLRRNPLAE